MAERHDLIGAGTAEAQERSAEEIRQDIIATREQIAETVDRLGDKIQETFDWREYIGRHPYAAIGVAAGVGLLCAGLFKRRASPSERIMDALAESVEDLSSRLQGALGDLPLPSAKKMGPGRTVKAAATAMITKAVVDFAKQRANQAIAARWQRSRAQPVVLERVTDESVIDHQSNQGGM